MVCATKSYDGLPSHALVIKDTWCNKIFGLSKVWEIRGSQTRRRGRVCIARSGVAELIGEVTLVDCIPVGRLENGELVPWSALEVDQLNFIGSPRNSLKHCIEDLSTVKYRKVYAWVLEERTAYVKPLPYTFKRGSVVWRRIL